MPVSEFLQWEMFVRDGGQLNDIVMRAAFTMISMQATKRVRPESIFPHLNPPRPEALVNIIRRRLGLAAMRDPEPE